MFPARPLVVRPLSLSLVAFGSLCFALSGASANDGGIAMGGSPRLLSGHRSVTMTSEVINLVVDEHKVSVDCQFVFTNHGPACVVRMGFPDEGYGADDPDEEEGDDVMRKPPKTTFTSFRSYVNGKPITARLIRAREPGHYWHAKMVRFPANGIVRVHDVYTQRIGGGIINLDGKGASGSQVAYVLHTGSSWHGSIGRSEINVTFRDKNVSYTPKLVPLTDVARSTWGRDFKVKSLDPKALVWKGPCAPQVQGKTLHFVRTNWRPTAKDDVELTYAIHSITSL